MKNFILIILIIFNCSKLVSQNCSHPQHNIEIFNEYLTQDNPRLYDWSSAGYQFGTQALPFVNHTEFHVKDFGAFPNDGIEDRQSIQAAIDAATAVGSGLISFDPGQYDFYEIFEYGLIISGSNIVLRGSQMGETILKQHNRIDGVDFSDRPNLIVANLNNPQSISNTTIVEDADRYSNTIKVVSSSGISSGDIILIEMRAPTNPDGSRSTELVDQYSSPLDGTDENGNAYIESNWSNYNTSNPFVFIVAVKSVDSNTNTLELVQVLPRNIEVQYNPRVRKIQPRYITEVGVEDLTLEGNYNEPDWKHHGSWEEDYAWGGIKFDQVYHSWIKNVQFTKILNAVSLVESAYCTVTDAIIHDTGHFGVRLGQSHNNLVSKITFDDYVHHLSLIHI